MKHILICGSPGCGKSTLIKKILLKVKTTVSGYITVKESALENENGEPVYLYPCGKPYMVGEGILLGYSKNRQLFPDKDAFDRAAKEIPELAAGGGLIVADEIGRMESVSEDFMGAVLKLLDGDVTVIAAVKNKDTEFLNKVRNHPNCRCFYINEENRNELYEEVRDILIG